MRKVTISACQFRVERTKSFDDFKNQVVELIEQVPQQSDYVIFPELFTVGLLTSFPDSEKLTARDLILIDKYTDDYKQLFIELAVEKSR